MIGAGACTLLKDRVNILSCIICRTSMSRVGIAAQGRSITTSRGEHLGLSRPSGGVERKVKPLTIQAPRTIGAPGRESGNAYSHRSAASRAFARISAYPST